MEWGKGHFFTVDFLLRTDVREKGCISKQVGNGLCWSDDTALWPAVLWHRKCYGITITAHELSSSSMAGRLWPTHSITMTSRLTAARLTGHHRRTNIPSK